MLYLKKEMPEKLAGLPSDLKSEAQRKSGCDLSNVKVYYNSMRPAHYQAAGIAQKDTIYLAPFHDNKLKHEVAHIIQQKQNIIPDSNASGSVVSNQRLEQEAEQFSIHNTSSNVQQGVTQHNVIQRYVVIHGTMYNDYTMLNEIQRALNGYAYRNGLPSVTERMRKYFEDRVYSTYYYGTFPSSSPICLFLSMHLLS